MTTRLDLAIVGGGFAGHACAQAARARGLEVAVLDRKDEPGAAVHTTGILVREAAEILPAPAALVRRIDKVRLYGPGLKHVDLASPGYYFLATDTPGLLRWYAAETVKSGARVIQSADFTGARRTDGYFDIETANGGADISARYLVGADGARSAVARAFGLGENRRYLVGVEAEYEGVGGVAPEFLHTFLDSRLAPGYIAWLVPGVGGVTQVGLACRRPAKPSLDAFIAKISGVAKISGAGKAPGLFDFSGARVVARRSGPIPVGGMVHPVSTAGVALVGDAAGIVSPLTAGGIYTAVKFGHLAGAAVADYLLAAPDAAPGDVPDPGAVLARAYPRFRVKSLLRRAADLGPPNFLYDLALALPPFRRAAQLVYFHNKGLGARAAWRDLIRGGA